MSDETTAEYATRLRNHGLGGAAEIIESLQTENKLQAQRIEELEAARTKVADAMRVGLVTLDHLEEENATLREKVKKARKHLERAFDEDIDLAEGTANIRLALEALGAGG